MRHLNSRRKLGRNSGHRKALEKNILRSLFDKGRIITTISKAKEYAPQAEKIITLAKRAEQKIQEMKKKTQIQFRGDITAEVESQMTKQSKAIRDAYFRMVMSKLQDIAIVERVFHDYAPAFAQRKGGYTSILRLSQNRIGDNAPRAIVRFIEEVPRSTKPVDSAVQKNKEKALEKRIEMKRKKRERMLKEREEIKQKKEKEKKKKAQEKS